MKFKDALQNSVKFLSSQEFLERVKEEDELMIQHIPKLKEINAHGFLTENSQGGHKSSGISQLDGRHYEISERAYLTGFMLEKDAVTFLKKCNLSSDKNVVFVPYCEDSIYIPSSLDIPLTITKKGKETSVSTHTSSALPISVWHSYRKQSHINKSEKIVFLQCWDTKWNRNASSKSGLFTDILRVLKTL
jgi:hypothetical protein